ENHPHFFSLGGFGFIKPKRIVEQAQNISSQFDSSSKKPRITSVSTFTLVEIVLINQRSDQNILRNRLTTEIHIFKQSQVFQRISVQRIQKAFIVINHIDDILIRQFTVIMLNRRSGII